MEQDKRREYLIRELLKEEPRYRQIEVPKDAAGQKDLLRSLMNVRPPRPVSEEFLSVQDAYLRRAISEKGITRLEDLSRAHGSLYLWKGDITTLECGAIVNAANSRMLGCFRPLHACIDNCIHTYAGVQLRLKCAQIMEAQGYEEPTGRAKITPAYNLPAQYVLHTVGPIVHGRLMEEHERLLASCYSSCLELAAGNGLESVAFCCISPGVFMFPNRRAAEIAVKTVGDWLRETGSGMKVIFNVFKDTDLAIYQNLLNEYTP